MRGTATTRVGPVARRCRAARTRPRNPQHSHTNWRDPWGPFTVDPIEGGCANDYTYVHGDPVNSSDTTGTNWLSDRLSDAWNWTQNSCLGPIALGAVAVLAPAPIGLAIAGASLYSSIRSTTGARSSGERASSLAGSTTTFIGITLTAASGKSYAARVGGRALGVFGIGISVWSNMESGKCRWK